VEAVPARAGSLPLIEELSGIVRARNQVAIRSEINAGVTEVLVRDGDAVRVGQPLVRLDDVALSEQLRRADADLQLAEATATEARARVAEVRARTVRTRSLAADGLASDLDLETFEAQLAAVEAGAAQARARVAQAEATVQERRSALGKTTIRAPVSGRVGQRNVEVGMVVSSGMVLFLVGDFDELIVETPLTQELLRTVEKGTPVEIEARGMEGGVHAQVSRISPFLEAGSFSTTAEIDVTSHDGALRPGMFVTVRVEYGASDLATVVPASAIWEDPLTGDATVFVVEDAQGLVPATSAGGEVPDTARRVVQRPVDVLAEGGGEVGVKGVTDGEWVVTLGQHLLQEALTTAEGGAITARVRATSWSRVVELQGMQREDLLTRFLAKQRVVARAFGAELPENIALVDEVVRAAAEGEALASPSPGADALTAAGS
jgi:RND family efflux transporter MFP subunit